MIFKVFSSCSVVLKWCNYEDGGDGDELTSPPGSEVAEPTPVPGRHKGSDPVHPKEGQVQV